MKRLTLVALALAAAVLACKPQSKSPAPGQPEGTAPVARSPDAVKLEFFVMSQCPYGVQVVNGVKDAADKMGPNLDLTIDFIGDIQPDGSLGAMHGPDEVAGNMVQACALKHAPAKALDMMVCQNKEMKKVHVNWEPCAQELRMPVEALRTCLTGPEGKELLTASYQRAKARNASGSPTMFLNGQPYQGSRSPSGFLVAVCDAYKGATPPAACADLPKTNVTVLTDKRCPDCRDWTSMLKTRMAAPVLRQLDYADEEGKKLHLEVGGGNLPMVLFDATLDSDKEAVAGFQRFLKPAGALRSLDLNSGWNPACADEGGCDKPDCKAAMFCRAEVPAKLDVFVMSQCPYGVKALDAMPEVLKNFGGKLDFTIHYIATGTAKDGFKALHGQPEVDENIRQLCAIKNYGKNAKYMDYILCRNKDYRSDKWEPCATGGIDPKVIAKCATGDEGKKLLETDSGIGNALGIGGSPTWLANNKHKFSGVDAETVRRNVCQHNPGLKGCENTLSGAAHGGHAGHAGCGK